MTDPRDSLVLVLLYWAGIVGLILLTAYTLWYVCHWKRVKRATCWSCCQEHPETDLIELPASRYQRGRFVCPCCHKLILTQ